MIRAYQFRNERKIIFLSAQKSFKRVISQGYILRNEGDGGGLFDNKVQI